jgi:hypothetical protein
LAKKFITNKEDQSDLKKIDITLVSPYGFFPKFWKKQRDQSKFFARKKSKFSRDVCIRVVETLSQVSYIGVMSEKFVFT